MWPMLCGGWLYGLGNWGALECEDDEELPDEDRGELCRLARDGDTFRVRLVLSLPEDVLGRLLDLLE